MCKTFYFIIYKQYQSNLIYLSKENKLITINEIKHLIWICKLIVSIKISIKFSEITRRKRNKVKGQKLSILRIFNSLFCRRYNQEKLRYLAIKCNEEAKKEAD